MRLPWSGLTDGLLVLKTAESQVPGKGDDYACAFHDKCNRPFQRYRMAADEQRRIGCVGSSTSGLVMARLATFQWIRLVVTSRLCWLGLPASRVPTLPGWLIGPKRRQRWPFRFGSDHVENFTRRANSWRQEIPVTINQLAKFSRQQVGLFVGWL
jgi:hypothetical protein